jgi:hypothetical protein
VLVSYTFHLLNTKAAEVIPEAIRGFYEQQVDRLDGSPESHRAAGLALLGHEAWVKYYANFWSEHVLHDQRIAQTIESQGLGHYLKFVRYEALRADVETNRRELYRHVGVNPELARAVSGESNTAPGFAGRDDPRSFYRRGEAGDWRNYFAGSAVPGLAEWFEAAAGKALIATGYEHDGSWVNRAVLGMSATPAMSAEGAEHSWARLGSDGVTMGKAVSMARASLSEA